jgi:hypothetical protein
MKRLTKNRIKIMQCLTEGNDDCGLAPYSASSIHYMLYGFEFMKDKAREKTQMNQIRRTLNELVADGIAIMSRRLYTEGKGLPYWENLYQIADMAEANHFECELRDIERKISRANGYQFFGAKFDGDGLTESDKKELTAKVKRLIQKTHPDKVSGKEHHFKKMKKCLDILREMPTKK